MLAEVKRQSQLLSVLSAQRGIKGRDSTVVERKDKDTRAHVRIKEPVILDLTKRCNEISNRLKEFSALYEVVKNERNKYVNLIQSSNQGLSEMREEIQILLSEVEILGNANYTASTILQLVIKPVSGQTYTINTTPHDSITTIKSKIFDHDGTPPALQRLVSSSKPLNEASIGAGAVQTSKRYYEVVIRL